MVIRIETPSTNRCNHGYIEYEMTHISLDIVQQQTKRKSSYNLTRDGEIITYSLKDRSQQLKSFTDNNVRKSSQKTTLKRDLLTEAV
jgi:hypothetical protein